MHDYWVWRIHDGHWGFWGMHVLWWLFWVALIAGVIYLLVSRRRRETPLELLQRRYAAGEISTGEYEARKAVLERDAERGG